MSTNNEIPGAAINRKWCISVFSSEKITGGCSRIHVLFWSRRKYQNAFFDRINQIIIIK